MANSPTDLRDSVMVSGKLITFAVLGLYAMSQISAVIITFNEARHIEACIASLLPVADEILVLDSFSTDNTPALAKAMGATVVQRAWEGYSASKNYANQLATHDYVLSLDADERLSEALQAEILALKPQLANYDAYRMRRLNNYCGHWIRYGNWYPEIKLRLWHKQKGAWQGLVHEAVVMASPAKSLLLKQHLLHYNYATITEHLSQINKFTDLSAQDYHQRGKKKYVLFFILFSPLLAFWKSFLVKRGFWDGYYGFLVSMMEAYATFLKYVKLKALREQAAANSTESSKV
ncbi:glycosyltransferase family 2 protein [Eisenibacter elegans]|uniref:glycosyltransferase family 2 protein n=1 Tax=Eisenibacter elegans TaxID=997 RepID=UPI001FE087EC|nr:glycosyltransferase family 2 protein [Eisenibacter elegans]